MRAARARAVWCWSRVAVAAEGAQVVEAFVAVGVEVNVAGPATVNLFFFSSVSEVYYAKGESITHSGTLGQSRVTLGKSAFDHPRCMLGVLGRVVSRVEFKHTLVDGLSRAGEGYIWTTGTKGAHPGELDRRGELIS